MFGWHPVLGFQHETESPALAWIPTHGPHVRRAPASPGGKFSAFMGACPLLGGFAKSLRTAGVPLPANP